MKFDIEKKGYKRVQVDEYIFSLRAEYESKLTEQKERIFQIKSELAEKEKQLADYASKRDLVATALINAVAKADEIEKLAATRYREEIVSLKNFHDKWQAHYNKLLEKYPNDQGLKAVEKFNDAVNEVLAGGTDTLRELESQFNSESNRVNETTSSTKKQTLAENTTSKSGFSFADAWNPTDDLNTIMKDLGLLKDENNKTSKNKK